MKLTFSASDSSGIAANYYQIDDDGLYEGNIREVDPSDVGQGLHTVCAAAVDMAGNGSTPRIVKIGIDTRRPTKTWPLNHPTVASGGVTTLKYSIADPEPSCGKAKVTLLIAKGRHIVKRMGIGTVATNWTVDFRFHCTLPAGKYLWGVMARDIAGNAVAAKSIWVWTLTVR